MMSIRNVAQSFKSDFVHIAYLRNDAMCGIIRKNSKRSRDNGQDIGGGEESLH